MALSEAAATLLEATTGLYSATLKDENDTVISYADLDTLTVTYYNKADGSIINSRTQQDVLNKNNVTVSEAGVLEWEIQPADTVIVDTTLTPGQKETHVALFEWTYDSGTNSGRHELTLYVKQLNEVTLSAGATLVSSYGGAAANTYCSLTEANSFITTAILDNSAWNSAKVAEKAAALLQATREIDSRNYIYGRYYTDQSLSFPRAQTTGSNITLTTSTLHTVAYTQQREAVRQACCHQAVWLLRNSGRNDMLETILQGVTWFSKRVGPISESYQFGASGGGAGAGGGNPLCPDARRLLATWYCGPRVVRA